MLQNDFSYFNNVICNSLKCFKFSLFEGSTYLLPSIKVSIRINIGTVMSSGGKVVFVVYLISKSACILTICSPA